MNNQNEIHEHKKSTLKYRLVFLLCVLVVISIIVPMPYYIEVPGTAENVRDFVSVDNRENTNPGSFMLTTVGVRQGTAASLLVAKFSPFQEIISKKDLMGESTNEEYERITQYEMASSENMAKKVALDLVKEPYELKYEGVYVMNVTEDSNFKDSLQTGDVVYQVEDLVFQDSAEFMKFVKNKKVGEQINIKYKRNGKDKSASGKLINLKEQKKAGLGITLVDKSELQTDKDIIIQAEDIGGPSAGLMFTLELYDILSEKDLRKGREIAGTGTINSDGSVGSIGGIDKKIVAADREGAEIFFAPDEPIDKEVKKIYPDLKTNYEVAKAAAKKIDTKMKVVPVRNVQQALDYLNK